MRPMGLAAWTLGFAVAAILTARAAPADILAPGTHSVKGEVTIEFGPFADHVTWRYEVKEGDTFASVAEKVLGDAKRVAAIAELNPGIDAAAPKVKTMLVLPPKATEAKGPRGVAWWDFLQQGGGGGGPATPLMPFFEGEKPDYPTGSWTYYAVPHDHLAAFRENKDGFRTDSRILLSEWVHFPSSANDSDATQRVVTKYRFGLKGERQLALEIVEQKRYDAKGVLLSEATGGEAPVPGTPIAMVLAIIGCLAVAAALYVGVMWRRRSRRAGGGATV